MDSVYICPECGREYDEPGICDTCQVELIEEGGEDEHVDETGAFQLGSGGFDNEEEQS